MRTQNKLRHRQQGIALVVFAIGLVVIIGMAGLALDLSKVMLDDARLQNAVDACALSGAQILLDTEDTALSAVEADATFKRNLGTALKDESVTVLFSDTLEGKFGVGGSSSRYVQCVAANYSYSSRLARVLGIDTLGLNVTAVSGPITIDNCNVVPLLVCGECGLDGTEGCNAETDCDPDGALCYGFEVYKEDEGGEPMVAESECYLKACSPGTKCQDLSTGKYCGAQLGAPDGGGSWAADVSAGNFDLLDMECVSGKKGTPCIKEAFKSGGAVIAGGCPGAGDYVTTKPGNTVSVIDAFNTLFDGPDPDDDPVPGLYSEYDGKDGNRRRELGVVIGDCTDPDIKPGKTEVPVLTIGCFFATQKGVKGGGTPVIWGEFIGECPDGKGPITKDPSVFETYKVVLYKDYKGPDS